MDFNACSGMQVAEGMAALVDLEFSIHVSALFYC